MKDELLAELQANHAASSKKNENGQGGNNDKYLVLPKNPCTIVLRFLPPIEKNGRRVLYQASKLHHINNKNIHCLKEYNKSENKWEGQCYGCEFISAKWEKSRAAAKLGNSTLAERLEAEARMLGGYERFYWNVLVMKWVDGEKPPVQEPKILSCGKELKSVILGYIIGDKDTNTKGLGEAAWDTKAGHNFYLKKGVKKDFKGEYPEYGKSKFDNDVSPLGDPDKVAKWLEARHDLTSLRYLLTPEEMADEIEYHRGRKTDPRGKNRYADDDDVNTSDMVTGGRHGDDEEVEHPLAASAASVEEESDALSQDDFMAKLDALNKS